MQFDMGVEDKLPFFVVLGDLLVLFDSLCQPQSCNAAVTRGKAKLVDEPSVTLRALPFYDSELDIQPGKSDQRRQERFQHTVVKPLDEVAPDLPLGFKVLLNMDEMQQDYPSLGLQKA